MRIRLKEGYQRKLVLLAKSENNFTWERLAERLGVARNYLVNEIRTEKRTLSEVIYNTLCNLADVNFDKHIVNRLDDNWGRSKGGVNSGSFREPKLLVKKTSVELAELIGIILGDGNIWCDGSKGYYYLRICGDSEKDRDYLLNYVKPLVENLFNVKMFFTKYTGKNEMIIGVGNKDVVHTLNYFGLPAGNKKKNDVGIPNWIFESDEYLKVCIRGLIDTDGCVCPITGRDYPYIWFTSNIENLKNTFKKAMDQLGFRTSKWRVHEKRGDDTYIGNKEHINKYIQTISFKNKRHLDRLSKFAPIVQRPRIRPFRGRDPGSNPGGGI